jgi:hypothetical protein
MRTACGTTAGVDSIRAWLEVTVASGQNS